MSTAIAEVEALFRYPVKSMAGERLESASLGWDGIDGDRRLAFQRVNSHSGMPWLTAARLPDLLLFTPQPRDDSPERDIPTHVRTPDGEHIAVFDPELAQTSGGDGGMPCR